MELEFIKKEGVGVISVKINEKEFTTKDYILMIKELKDQNSITAKYSDEITEDEKTTIDSMLLQINNISEEENQENSNATDEVVDLNF